MRIFDKFFGKKDSIPAPDFMPVLRPGAHKSPAQGACFMEYISVLRGEKFSDCSRSVNPFIANIARSLNDASYTNRLALVALMGPAMTTGTGNKSIDADRAERLREWVYQQGWGNGWYNNPWGDYAVKYLAKVIDKYHEWYGTEPHVITKAEVERVVSVGLPA